MRKKNPGSLAVGFGSLTLLIAATVLPAQQKVPFENNIPVAPRGLACEPCRAS